jgi:hypothetical protein
MAFKAVEELKPLKPKVQYLMCTSYEEPEKTFKSLLPAQQVIW